MHTEHETFCKFIPVMCSHDAAQVQFNVNCMNNMVFQAIGLLDTLDRHMNTCGIRVKYVHHDAAQVKFKGNCVDNMVF